MKTCLRSSLLLFVLLGCICSHAQVKTGIPPFASTQNFGVDTINLANLNVHMTFPIVHKNGRGLPFLYDLTYDSSVWSPVGGTWQPSPSFGWTDQTSGPLTGYTSYSASSMT